MAMAYIPALLTRPGRRLTPRRRALHPRRAHPQHAPRRRFADGEEPAAEEEAVARDRDGAGERVQEPADRLVVARLRQRRRRDAVELGDGGVGAHGERAVGVRLDALALLRLELVADLADDLLEHVLERADAHD